MSAPPPAEGSGAGKAAPPAPVREGLGGWALATYAALILFLFVVIGLELWAMHAADPDFRLLDAFHPFVAGLAGLVLTGLFLPWRPARFSVTVFACALGIFVLVGEYAAEVRSIRGGYVALSDDLLLRYTYKPGAELRSRFDDDVVVRATDDGLWELPRAKPKPKGVFRVVVLGDSVPNDRELRFSERFPRRLEALLAARAPAGAKVEVVNVSCDGYNTLQEVRLFEKVGVTYEPDLVVVGYVLNDPSLQNGGYRRVGNSFFLLHFFGGFFQGSAECENLAELHRGYSFDLVVKSSFERLQLLARLHRFEVVLGVLPPVLPFNDPVCTKIHDDVLAVGRAAGFTTVRVLDAFAGEDHRRFAKPDAPDDIFHPSAEAHARIAAALAEPAAAKLWPASRR